MSSADTSKPMNYLITGAAKGIGRSLTRSLISKGHRVFLLDNNEAELTHTLSLLKSQSSSSSTSQYSHAVCDLSDRPSIKAAVDSCNAFFNSHLDVLVNNAMALPHTWTSSSNTSESAGLEDGSDAEILALWDAKIAVGLTAPFYLSRLCIPMLKHSSHPSETVDADGNIEQRPGCIVNISSTRAHQAEVNHEGYSAAKAGLLGLTQSLAVSLGERYGIRVNAILPGWINVAEESMEADEKGVRWSDGLSKEDHSWHPAGRVGKGTDVCKAVEFLAGSDFVTGQEVVIDGGVGRKMVYPE